MIDKILDRMVNLSKNTIEHDAFDKMTYEKIAKNCSQLEYNSILAHDKYKYPFFDELQQDIFYSFFKYFPRFIDDDKIQDEFLIHKEIIEKAQKNENWRKMRNITKLDEVNSAIATAFFGMELLKEITKRDKKFMQQVNKIKEQREQLINLMKDFANANKHKRKKITNEIEKVMQNIKKQTKDAIKNISQISISQAIKKATKDMNNFYETTNVLAWGKEAMEMKRVNPEKRIILANYLLSNKKLLKLVKELGKLKNIFIETKRREIKHGTSELYSIEAGKDIGRLLPCEMIKLKHPVLKKDFYKRFLEGKLLQYSLRSKEKMGKGNIIVCLDCSGSMDTTLYKNITRETYGKALALAILEMAIRENRKYHLILFEKTVRCEYTFEKITKPSIDVIIDIASKHYGGGTNFEKPLERALDKVDKNADIVFITDGECRVGSDFLKKFNEAKEKMNFKVISLQVGNAPTQYLEEFSDNVINFTEFIETSKSVFSNLQRISKKAHTLQSTATY